MHAHDQRLIDGGREHLSRPHIAARFKRHSCHGLPNIKPAPVVPRLSGREVERQIAQRLIRPVRAAPKPAACLRGSFRQHRLDRVWIFLVGDQLPQRRQALVRFHAVGLRFQRTRPDRDLVQLQPLMLDAPEDHCAQASVAHGERLLPLPRRLLVPNGGGAGLTVGSRRSNGCDAG